MCHLVQSGQVTGNISLSRNPDKKKFCSFFKRVPGSSDVTFLQLCQCNFNNVQFTNKPESQPRSIHQMREQ